MQRALSLRPPYGTVFIPQSDGTMWLVYESTHIDVDKVVEWLRDTALNHHAQVKAADESMRQAQEDMKKVPKVDREREEKLRAHNWGGPYRLGAICKNCKVKADGLEPAVCEEAG